jgi:hypothetical protein
MISATSMLRLMVAEYTQSLHFDLIPSRVLTLSLLMTYTYGAPGKARNLMSYIHMDEIFPRDFAS